MPKQAAEQIENLGVNLGRRSPASGGHFSTPDHKTSPLSVPPPRSTRFGSPLVLSRVHWVEPKLVAEIAYLTWTAENLLRHTVYVGLRADKPAVEVRREAVRV
jgi:ATP-dependent DNA ligase